VWLASQRLTGDAGGFWSESTGLRWSALWMLGCVQTPRIEQACVQPKVAPWEHIIDTTPE
jgi:hypothetical protein